MFKVVKIGDKDVPMLGMASANVYYRRIFGADPLLIQDGSKELTPGESINLYMGMGFVMAKMAELKDRQAMLKLNEGDFIDWLDQFQTDEIIDALLDIASVYNGQNLSLSEKKAEDAR